MRYLVLSLLGFWMLIDGQNLFAQQNEQEYRNKLKTICDSMFVLPSKQKAEFCDCYTEQLLNTTTLEAFRAKYMELSKSELINWLIPSIGKCYHSMTAQYPYFLDSLVKMNPKLIQRIASDSSLMINYSQQLREVYMGGCVNSLKNNPNTLSINHKIYCSCIWDKTQKQYPNFTVFLQAYAQLGEQAISQQANSECYLDAITSETVMLYTPELKSQFISTCSQNLKAQNQTGLDADKFCPCMYEKIQKKYPNYADYLRLVKLGVQTLVQVMEKEMTTCIKKSSK